ncbi:MAG: hypothetical protein GXP62_17660 [Oligoflexia bacterium]|nr:hypothetical protein [Oligoflexia bacterium]
MDDRKHFISMLRPGRPTLHDDMTEDEEAIISAHGDYLRELFEAGKVIFAGPSTEGRFGLVVMESDSRDEVIKLMEADPAVSTGILTSEVTEFSVFLMRGTTGTRE